MIDFETPAPDVVRPQMPEVTGQVQRTELVRNRYFVVEEVTLERGAAYRGTCDGTTLEIWGCVGGNVAIEWEDAPVLLPAIRYTLLPAALGAFRVAAQERSTCLRAYLPVE